MAVESYLYSAGFEELLSRIRSSYPDPYLAFPIFIRELAKHRANSHLLEVGGGRTPLLTAEDVRQLGCTYTINDIDAGELALAPDWIERFHGDIADPRLVDVNRMGRYDLIFSKAVFEHVANPRIAYTNVANLLAPGGVVVNLIPTLYSIPFVVNRIVPERVSERVMRLTTRLPEDIRKFPAYYRWCTSTDLTARRIASVGLPNTRVAPFYGHGYYNRINILHRIAKRLWNAFEKHQLTAMSSYAYIFATDEA